MTSWQVLLLIYMTQGKYLSTRLPNEHDWLRLAMLVQETYPDVRVTV